MKKLLLLIPFIALISCGPSQEEINKKRTQDSLAVEIRKSVFRDSMNKINSARQADSIANEINKALNP